MFPPASGFTLSIDFLPPSKTHHCLSSQPLLVCFLSIWSWAKSENSLPGEWCWLSGCVSERPISAVQLGSAAVPAEPTIDASRNLDGESCFVLTFPLVCVFGCVCLQVVGLDADQRPFSRRGPAGEGQGSQLGGSEGPEGRLGSAEGLGRKLSGE